eukprot:98486_1
MIRVPFMGIKYHLFCHEPETTKEIFKLEAKGDLITYMPDHVQLLIGYKAFIHFKASEHKRVRKHFDKYFTDTALQYRYNIINEATQTFLDSLFNLTLQNNDYINISDICKKWSWQISMNVILGNDTNIFCETERENLLNLFIEWRVGGVDTNVENANKSDTLLGKAMIARNKILKQFKNIFERGKIKYLEDKLDEKSMLFGLIDRMYNNKDESNEFLSENELFDGLILIFHASYDTTASSCCNLLSVFYEYPQIFMKVREYCDKLLMETELDYNKLDGDEFLTRFVDEVLRYRPPVINLTKKAINDCIINGYFIPKNELITVCMALQGINNNIYTNADKFDMNRYIDCNKVKHKYNFTPFSSGNKKCLGFKLAKMELKIMSVMFATKCDFQIDEKRYKPTTEKTTRYVYDVFGRFYPRN